MHAGTTPLYSSPAERQQCGFSGQQPTHPSLATPERLGREWPWLLQLQPFAACNHKQCTRSVPLQLGLHCSQAPQQHHRHTHPTVDQYLARRQSALRLNAWAHALCECWRSMIVGSLRCNWLERQQSEWSAASPAGPWVHKCSVEWLVWLFLQHCLSAVCHSFLATVTTHFTCARLFRCCISSVLHLQRVFSTCFRPCSSMHCCS